jgi:serine/threonine-protein kinase
VQAEPETTPTSTATRETTTPTTPTPTPTLTPSPTATPTPQPTATEVPRVTVPDIRSLPEAEARNLLAQLGLQAVNGGSANDNNVPGGQVLAQQVPPGTQLVEGSPVTYTLSLGPQLVDVPDLERLRVGDAVAEAERLGLQVSIVEAPSQQIPEGFVISQQPKNVRVRAGETLLLTVSVGDQVRFPDVIGLQREQAMQVLQSAGLEIAAIDVQDRDRLSNFDSFLPNQVISAQVNGQPVDNGDFIPRNSSVVLGVRAP